MIVNVKEDRNRKVITIVDNNLIGKRFNEASLVLDLTYKYFSGVEKSKQDIKKLLNQKDVFLVNFIGEESVSFGKELGFVDEVKEIDKIKYAFFLKMI